MSGNSGERQSRRARKRRRKERERQLQASGAASSTSQLGIRDVFSPADATEPPAAENQETPELDSVAEQNDQSEHHSPAPASTEIVEVEESAPEQVAALQHELHEKDELLGALTEQLEEAANRLDRLHRAGADRASRVPVANGEELGAGPEISDQLARLCGDWEELQPIQQFEIIRGRLDDIYHAVTRAGPQSSHPYREPELEEEVSPSQQSQGATDSASSLPGWEAMKAQLLREGAEQGRSNEDVEEAVDEVGDDLGSAAEVLSDLPLEPPESVDLEDADRETLVAAVEERDVFISHLIERLRSGSSGGYAPINWAEISGAPDELRERLEEHEARLQELLRMEECDLSLERARLARERARLEQLRRDVERDSRGGELEDESSDRNERRWLRVFGFGRKPDVEDGDV